MDTASSQNTPPALRLVPKNPKTVFYTCVTHQNDPTMQAWPYFAPLGVIDLCFWTVGENWTTDRDMGGMCATPKVPNQDQTQSLLLWRNCAQHKYQIESRIHVTAIKNHNGARHQQRTSATPTKEARYKNPNIKWVICHQVYLHLPSLLSSSLSCLAWACRERLTETDCSATA